MVYSNLILSSMWNEGLTNSRSVEAQAMLLLCARLLYSSEVELNLSFRLKARTQRHGE